MRKYKPELGQAFFGCPTSEFVCPEYIEAGLKHLSDEIERAEWNIRQKKFDSPIHNNSSEYKTDAFQMRAYYWGDDEKIQALPNFICGDFEVRWYKYAGRGMSMNRTIDANEFFQIIDKCLNSVREREETELKKIGRDWLD